MATTKPKLELPTKKQKWEKTDQIDQYQHHCRANYRPQFINILVNEAIVRQVEKVHVYFNGVSRNRAPFLKGLMQINCPIYIIWEGTRRPHNGCRLPKKRRR